MRFRETQEQKGTIPTHPVTEAVITQLFKDAAQIPVANNPSEMGTQSWTAGTNESKRRDGHATEQDLSDLISGRGRIWTQVREIPCYTLLQQDGTYRLVKVHDVPSELQSSYEAQSIAMIDVTDFRQGKLDKPLCHEKRLVVSRMDLSSSTPTIHTLRNKEPEYEYNYENELVRSPITDPIPYTREHALTDAAQGLSQHPERFVLALQNAIQLAQEDYQLNSLCAALHKVAGNIVADYDIYLLWKPTELISGAHTASPEEQAVASIVRVVRECLDRIPTAGIAGTEKRTTFVRNQLLPYVQADLLKQLQQSGITLGGLLHSLASLEDVN